MCELHKCSQLIGQRKKNNEYAMELKVKTLWFKGIPSTSSNSGHVTWILTI